MEAGPSAVVLRKCQGTSQMQRWTFDTSDTKTTIYHASTNSCLEVLPDLQLVLRPCSPENESQFFLL